MDYYGTPLPELAHWTDHGLNSATEELRAEFCDSEQGSTDFLKQKIGVSQPLRTPANRSFIVNKGG